MEINQHLGLESLKSRRWFVRLCHFYRILNGKSPLYLVDLIPNLNRVHETRHSNNIPGIHARHDYFKNSPFPSTISEWNKLDWTTRDSGSVSVFKSMRPCVNSIFDIHGLYGIKLLTRLRLSLSHLREHKFRHCFHSKSVMLLW